MAAAPLQAQNLQTIMALIIKMNSRAQTFTKLANEERNQQQSEYKTLLAANVIANPETGVISVRGTNKQHERVQEFIDKVMGSAKRQVLIEATIVEVSLKDGFQQGLIGAALETAQIVAALHSSNR